MGLEGSHCAIESRRSLAKPRLAALVSVRPGPRKQPAFRMTGGPDQVFRLNGTTGGGHSDCQQLANVSSTYSTPTAAQPTATPSVHASVRPLRQVATASPTQRQRNSKCYCKSDSNADGDSKWHSYCNYVRRARRRAVVFEGKATGKIIPMRGQ